MTMSTVGMAYEGRDVVRVLGRGCLATLPDRAAVIEVRQPTALVGIGCDDIGAGMSDAPVFAEWV